MNKKRLLTMILLLSLCLNSSFLYSAQTLQELEDEIAQIEAETEKALKDKDEIAEQEINTKSDILDVRKEIDDMQAKINTQQASIDSKNSEIVTQESKIAEIEAQIPKVKDETGEILKVLQKTSNSNMMINMVLNTDEDSNILLNIHSMNLLTDYATDEISKLIEIEKELQYEKTVLEKQKAELEQEQANLEIQQAELESKEAQFQAILEEQKESVAALDNSAAKSSEDAQMKADALAYYESLGCTANDTVGSKCGILADDDGDGVANVDDSCPNEFGTESDGCESETTDSGNNAGNNNSGNNNNGSNGNGNGNSGGNSNGGGSTGTSASFSRPLSSGVVTCDYGCYDGHVGIDMDYADNVPILATSDGVVTTSKGGCAAYVDGVNTCNGGYGNYVMVTHYTDEGIFFSLYAHMSSISVSQGQKVSQGQQVGLLGDSGNSQGSHLHFELYKDTNSNGIPDDYKTDPRAYLSLPPEWTWW